MNNIQSELKRCKRTLKGKELSDAQRRAHRLTMAELGVSSTNLVFDSEKASQYLSDEIIDILRDDPTIDDGIMFNRVPTETVYEPESGDYVIRPISTITESQKSGHKGLDTDSDDDEQLSFYSHYDLDQLDHVFSSSEHVINRLPYWIHDLQCWKNGFNAIKWARHNHLEEKKRHALAFTDDQLTVNGTPRKRKAETKPRRKRVPRKQSRMTGLPAK